MKKIFIACLLLGALLEYFTPVKNWLLIALCIITAIVAVPCTKKMNSFFAIVVFFLLAITFICGSCVTINSVMAIAETGFSGEVILYLPEVLAAISLVSSSVYLLMEVSAP